MKAKLQKQITKNSVIFAAAVSGLICSICLSVPEISFLIFFALIPFLFFFVQVYSPQAKNKNLNFYFFHVLSYPDSLMALYFMSNPRYGSFIFFLMANNVSSNHCGFLS